MRYFILFLFFGCFAQAQEKPTYQEVLVEFHKNYMPRFEGPSEPVWEKHPDGWYYTVYNFDGQAQISGRYLFWDAKTGAYQKLDFDAAPEFRDPKAVAENEVLRTGKPYQLQAFYGYAGWEDDVIDSLAGKEDLSDDQLYALGRAYSSKATSLIEARGAIFQDAKKAYISSPDDKLSDGELLEYMHNRENARNCFRSLSRQTKNYPTPVGEPEIKAANEIMTAYLDLRQYYSYAKAKSLLTRNLYHSFISAEARNRLISCPPNAILITNGDNDTYPLYYEQDFHKVRPDVRVLNRSLLNIPAYINFYREAHGEQQAINLSLSEEMLANEASQITLVRPEGERESIKWEDLVRYLKDPKNHFVGTKMSTWKSPSPFVEINYRGTTLVQRIDRGTRSEMLLLDIMANNDAPLCFDAFTEGSKLMSFSSHLVRRGMAILLDTVEYDVTPGQLGTVDFDASYNLLMEDWGYRDYGHEMQSAQKYALGTRVIFINTLFAKPDSTYDAKCLELLDQLEEYVPTEKFPHKDQVSLQLAMVEMSFERIDKALQIVDQVKFHQEKVLASMPEKREAERAEFILDYANQIRAMLVEE